MDQLEGALQRLRDNNIQVHIEETFLASTHFDYLGYHLTPNEIKPQEKKLKAILNIDEPKSVRELSHFIGFVQHYRDMFHHRSDALHPLTEATSKSIPKEKLTPLMDKSFKDVKRIIGQNVLLEHPGFSKPFEI